MFDSQILIALDESADYSVFSPWFARQGDSATFTLDITAVGGSTNLDVRIFTKNSEDIGDGDEVPCSPIPVITGNAVNRYSDTWEGCLKELVRYKFTMHGTANGGDWRQFRMLPPVWFNAVAV